MKKCLFALLAGAALFAGCEKVQEQELTEVSFETAIPIVSDDGVATFSLVSDYAGTETVKVPVKFSSSNGAVQRTDYTVSAEEFVLGGTAPVSKITVTPLIYGSKKDITAEITIPEGFKAGKYVKSTFSVSDKLGYVSFSSKKAIMTETATVSINVLNENGADKKVNENTEFTVNVNPKSTAIEGTNFKFTAGKTVKVEKGQSSADIQLEFLGETVDDEHNVLVLDLVENPKYAMGQTISTTITLAGSTWNVFNGKWVIKEYVNTLEEFYNNSMETEESMAGFPRFNAEDSFTIDFSTGTFIPDFKSSFKNYFIGTSNFTTCGKPQWQGTKFNIALGMSQKYMANVIELDNVNRYFSATETSENKLAYVGLSIDTEDSNLLHFLVVDHETKTFLFNSIKNWGGRESFFNSLNRPTANMSGIGFEVTFTKVK